MFITRDLRRARHFALADGMCKAPPRFEHRIADVGRIGENRGRLGAVLAPAY